MTKQERAIKARAHYEDIKTRLAANTKLSIERTYVYSPDSFTQHESGNQKPAFTLTDMDSVSCLFNLSDKQKKADVITCAAPNFRTAHRYQSVSKSENDRVLENRIHFMYQIAEENGVENLVAGAWGCGVFMQDPYTVATLLIGAARNYNIPNIYFAIPRILEH